MKKNLVKFQKRAGYLFILMAFLFLFCFLCYTKVGRNIIIPQTPVNTEITDQDNVIAKRLAEIIPFVNINDLKYTTAYQEQKITNADIANEVFLKIAYDNITERNQSNFNDYITRLYGGNLFIINKSFNVDGVVTCTFKEDLSYDCLTKTYSGITYSLVRSITKLSIIDDDYYLNEDVIFYTFEEVNGKIIYTIYDNSNYQNKIATFTDEERQNYAVTDYILAKYKTAIRKYQSKFIINNNTYRWQSTERITT